MLMDTCWWWMAAGWEDRGIRNLDREFRNPAAVPARVTLKAETNSRTLTQITKIRAKIAAD
jgi:hypothetical protein